jgi:hypothetical protein
MTKVGAESICCLDNDLNRPIHVIVCDLPLIIEILMPNGNGTAESFTIKMDHTRTQQRIHEISDCANDAHFETLDDTNNAE